MFQVGDIIKHKRSETYYLVVEIKKYLFETTERLEFIALDMANNFEVRIHYPLMTLNYEKIA